MNKKSSLFVLLSVIAASIVTGTRFVAPFGINLNLVLSLLAAWTLLLDGRPLYFLLGLIAALASKSSPGFEWGTAAFLVLPFVFYGLRFISPLRPAPTVFALAVVGTFVFYAIVNFNFITARTGVVFGEALFNSLAATAFYRLIEEKNEA
jgi:hypothetical protein